MTLDDLKLKLPASMQPLAVQYGPVFLAMGEAEIVAWIQRVATGDVYGAYTAINAKLSNADLLAKMQDNLSAWDKANTANAARMDVMGQAAMAVMKVLLGVAMAAAGF